MPNDDRVTNCPEDDWSRADDWTIAQGEHDGAPIFIRVNVGARPLVGEPTLPYRLGIAVPFLSPTADGLPNSDEAPFLDQIEDSIQEALGVNKSGVLVLAITTNGMREFVAYVRHESAAGEVVRAAQKAGTSYEVQSYVQPDPEWELFKEMMDDFK